MEHRSTDEQSATFRLDLTPDDLQIVRTALMLLKDTLGRDEAEELREVQALLARLP